MFSLHQKLRRLYASKSYKRIFFSLIALLTIVVLLVSAFFYGTFIRRQKEEITSRALESLTRIENQMSERFREMMRIVLAINENGVFSYAPITSKQQRETLLKELMRYVDDNGFLMDMSYESLLDSGHLYSSQGILSKAIFEKYIYGRSNDFDAAAFETRRQSLSFATVPSGQVMVRCYPTTAMSFVYGLPLLSANQRRFVSFYVDKMSVDAIVERFLPCDVLDVRFYESGAPVYSFSGGWSINKQAVKLAYSSKTTAYSYELLADPAVLFAPYRANQIFFFAMLGAALLVILLASGVVALYNYHPLYRLVSKYAAGEPEKMDEIALLNDLVESTIEQKRLMQQNLFISNLVWEQYETSDALNAAALEAGIAFSYPVYLCCAIQYEDTAENAAFAQRLSDALDTPDSMAVSAKRAGENRLTVVVNYTGAEQAHAAILKTLGALSHAFIGVGSPENGPLRLSASYNRARHAMHYAREHRLPLLPYTDLPAKNTDEIKTETPVASDLQARILACMQSNLSDTALSLEFIAGQCGVSASYLVRYFKGCMAVTPMQYVDTLRMDIAKHLLSTTGCTLRQIVGQCGYLDESNFARKFKKLEGVTPMSYRKMHWQG